LNWWMPRRVPCSLRDQSSPNCSYIRDLNSQPLLVQVRTDYTE
jgi:hypothetical protein